uniref:KTSC domain-containing protein n=1 Tax=Meloidogyne hapla TaxID=6305 RepID=A0A1I8AXQ3_MELHA
MEEIKIIRCWIEKISRCYFEQINFLSTVINPEMIHLIFDNEEIDKIKFSCNSSHYSYVYDESAIAETFGLTKGQRENVKFCYPSS